MHDFDAYGYPRDWLAHIFWQGKLSVNLGYPVDGWVEMSLHGACWAMPVTIKLSDVYDPFFELFDFLTALASANYPATLKIDEESTTKEIEVKPFAQNEDKETPVVEFRVIGDHWVADDHVQLRCFFLGKFEPKQVLSEFVFVLEDWINRKYDPEHWQYCYAENHDDVVYADVLNRRLSELNKRLAAD